MLRAAPDVLTLNNGIITAPNGQSVAVSQVALHALYVEHQQIMAIASEAGHPIPPSFAALGAEVEVDIETGVVHVLNAISSVDAGRIVNPIITEGQIEGGVAQALGYGICEEMIYDPQGRLLTSNLSDYHIYNAVDMPAIQSYLVETAESSSLFGIKAIDEISMNGMAPAVVNAVADALGMRIHQLPLTPERILRAIDTQGVRGR